MLCPMRKLATTTLAALLAWGGGWAAGAGGAPGVTAAAGPRAAACRMACCHVSGAPARTGTGAGAACPAPRGGPRLAPRTGPASCSCSSGSGGGSGPRASLAPEGRPSVLPARPRLPAPRAAALIAWPAGPPACLTPLDPPDHPPRA
jgi:hypothetical protein